MRKIIFLDTETTGNTEEDFLIELAYKSDKETFSQRYKAPKKIPPEASAVHHITNKMVEDKSAFRESKEYAKIKKLLEDEGNIVVAHNALFDLMMLEKEDIRPKDFICTLRLARYLDKEDKVERYNLQYLRYLIGIEIEAPAHDALGDVLVLEKLFDRLQNKMMESEGLDEEQALEKMIEVSAHPSLLGTFRFGKYNGRKVEEVAREDRGYLEWLLNEKKKDGGNDEDWVYTLEHYLKK